MLDGKKNRLANKGGGERERASHEDIPSAKMLAMSPMTPKLKLPFLISSRRRKIRETATGQA